MSDQSTTVAALKELVHAFVDERDWQQFHSPKNLTMALSIEVSELMEHFQWISLEQSRVATEDPEKPIAVEEELADVLCYVIAIANELQIDLSEPLRDKMVKNAVKYPASDYRGRYGPEDQGDKP